MNRFKHFSAIIAMLSCLLSQGILKPATRPISPVLHLVGIACAGVVLKEAYSLNAAYHKETPEELRTWANYRKFMYKNGSLRNRPWLWAAIVALGAYGTRRLTYQPIDVNAVDDHGRTALIRAAGYGETKTVQALLATRGIDVNAADNYGNTALINAARFRDTEAVQALLAAPEINVSAANQAGDTALSVATENGNQEIITLLNTAGAH